MEPTKLSARIRRARLQSGMTLRDVENLSGKEISNAYVSQIELGHEADPHPGKLRVISRVLKIPFLELMVLAGYLTIRDLKGRV